MFIRIFLKMVDARWEIKNTQAKPRGYGLSGATIAPAAPVANQEASLADNSFIPGTGRGAGSLPAGKSMIPGSPAAFAAVAMGLPAQGSWLVRANAILDVRTEAGKSILHGVEVPIEFTWSPSQEIRAKQRWLRQYLATSKFEKGASASSDFQQADAFLKIPVVAAGITPDELMDAIGRAKRGFLPQEKFVLRLDQLWGSDAEVIWRYRQGLLSGDTEMMRDLDAYAPHIWADDFVEPLVRMVENRNKFGTNVYSNALSLLEKHHEVWAGNVGIGPRLHRALVNRPEFVQSQANGTATLQFLRADPEKWSQQVRMLAYTHDPILIAELRPFLYDTSLVFDATVESSGVAVSTRICDYAHDAILHILGEAGEYGVLGRGGYVPFTAIHQSRDWIWPQWDRENAALAERLLQKAESNR